jgi:hypothetical protein
MLNNGPWRKGEASGEWSLVNRKGSTLTGVVHIAFTGPNALFAAQIDVNNQRMFKTR